MLLYAVSALMEFLMNSDVLGATVLLFRVYYILAAPLVGLLGAGVFYLLAPRRIAHYFLGFIIILSTGLAIMGFMTPLNQAVITQSFNGPLSEGFRAASQAYPMSVRIFAIILNSVGGIVLIGGAGLSVMRNRTRTYNIPLIIGGLLPMIGGSLLGFFGNPDVFFEFELGGAVFLFFGFILSDRYLRKIDAQHSKAQQPKLQ